MKLISTYEEALAEIRRFGHSYNEDTKKCNKCNISIKIVKDFVIASNPGYAINVYTNGLAKIGRGVYVAYAGVERNWFVCEKVKILL